MFEALSLDVQIDLAGFTVGAVEREDIITGADIGDGDTLLGLASSGLHSNGFSLVRKIIESTQGFDYEASAPFAKGQTMAEALLTPTRLYVKSILAALTIRDDVGKPAIKGMAHITGGGLLENVPRMMPKGLCAEIDCTAWELPSVFKWLMEAGNLNANDMGTTLNAGIGMVVAVPKAYKDAVRTSFEENGERVYEIGRVTKGGAPIVLRNAEECWG